MKTIFVLCLAPLTFAQTSTPPARTRAPIVFIDGNGSEMEAARETKHVRRDDQTMELARNLLKSCPEISISRKEDSTPDYFLLFNRGNEYGLFANAASQIMLLDREKNVIYSSKQGTVARAAKDGCKAVLADWKVHRLQPESATDSRPSQKPAPQTKQNNLPDPVTEGWWTSQKPAKAEVDPK